MAPPAVRRRAELVLVAAFFVVLYLPLVDRLVGLDPTPELVEKRALRGRPSLPRTLADWEAYPAAFTAHWDDTFGFRRSLVRANSYLKILGFSTRDSRSVVVGSDDWLFYGGTEALLTYGRSTPFPPDELRDWTRMLAVRQAWLDARGIRSLFYVAPIKHTIYGEFMPTSVPRGVGPDRLDQLTQALDEAGVTQLDLRPALRAVKPRWRAYHRTDTHWNQIGGAVATLEVARRLQRWFPAIRPTPLEGYQITEDVGGGRDLSHLLGLEGYYSERNFELEVPGRARLPLGPLSPDRFPPGEGATLPWMYSVTEGTDASLPVGMLFRDSFSDNMIPFLAPYFRRLVCVWSPNLDPTMVERERPDVVLVEVVERHLMKSNFRDPPGVGVSGPGEDFLAAGRTLVTLDPAAGFAGLRAGGQVALQPEATGLMLRCGGEDPWVLVDLPAERGGDAVMRVVLEVTQRSYAEVRAPVEMGPRVESRWLQSQLALPGVQELYFRVPADAGSTLRFDPAGVPGNVLLRSLEVRVRSETSAR